MSSSNLDSLSDLAAKATEVKRLLDHEGLMDAQRFERLHELINELQVACPNHPGVLDARVRWYEHALENFETHFVSAAEQHLITYEMEVQLRTVVIDARARIVPHLFVTVGLLNHFMRRHYLKGQFPRLYTRLHNAYRRATETAWQKPESKTLFHHFSNNLEAALLDGSF